MIDIVAAIFLIVMSIFYIYVLHTVSNAHEQTWHNVVMYCLGMVGAFITMLIGIRVLLLL